MYEQFFGLRELPFTLTPNTHFFLKSETHQLGLETLLVALQNKEGFIKLTGEVGTGKTLLCRKLLNALETEFVTAYIPNPCCSPETLYCLIADELGIDPDQSHTGFTSDKQVLALRLINEKLLQLASEGKRVVLIIDEAQSMPMASIEALRLLTNLETESEKLLQIVLFGQPELDTLLSQPELRQLKQRITFQHRLAVLSQSELERYISHRMILAGYTGQRLFEASAVQALHQASQGVPRLINILCHKALMLAYGQGSPVVQKAHMKAAIKDTESAYNGWRLRLPWKAAMAAFAVPMIPVLQAGQDIVFSALGA